MTAPTEVSTWTTDDLLKWADHHYPEAARQTRAVVGRPDTYARYVGRLDAIWWRDNALVWAGWTRRKRAVHQRRADVLVAGGLSAREACRTTYLEIHGTDCPSPSPERRSA